MEFEPEGAIQSTVRLYKSCITLFGKILSSKPHEAFSSVEITKWHTPLSDELGRLKIWAFNCGAHQPINSTLSLDHRLRGAPNAKIILSRLLYKLEKQLGESLETITKKPESTTQYLDDDSDDSDGINVNDMIADLELNSQSDLELNFFVIHGTITHLYRLIAALRPAVQKNKQEKYQEIDVSAYEPHDYNHVTNKYPDVAQELAARLGRANSQRRQFFKYQENHHKKLSQEEEDNFQEDGQAIRAKTVTTATTFEDDAIETRDSGNGDRTACSDDINSVTSYATSAAIGEADLKVPSPPGGIQGEPFECPYCFKIVTATNSRSWRRHVFQDLRPYLCTFDNCIDAANTLYGSRREWFEHELAFHRREWHCRQCNFETSRENEMVKHMEKKHSDVYKDYVAATILKRCERPIRLPQECGICKKILPSNQIRKHLAKHMQQLALFVLPKQEHDQSTDDDEQSNSDTDQGSGLDADVARPQKDAEGTEPDADAMKPMKRRNTLTMSQAVNLMMKKKRSDAEIQAKPEVAPDADAMKPMKKRNATMSNAVNLMMLKKKQHEEQIASAIAAQKEADLRGSGHETR
ncbi:hypothetical protein DFH27DRAFT_524520 [Peziza echinospora]|nr:hypothetical protein DFH27DRAFT_524520 [Peziza echinospora]